MADEITASDAGSITNAAWINPEFQATKRDLAVASQFAYEKSLDGKGSDTVQFPSIDDEAGSPGDRGAGVDDEFDADEVVDPGNTAMTMSDNTVTSGEYIIIRELGRNAEEDSIAAFDIMSEIVRDAAEIISLAKDYDVVNLFSSFNETKGTSGSAMTFQDMSDCITQLRHDGVRTPAGPGGLVFILGNEQGQNFEDEQTSKGSSQAQYQMTAERALRINPDIADGLVNRALGTFKGHAVFESGQTQTANTGDDEVGACLVRGDIPMNRHYAPIGAAVSRLFTVEEDDAPRKRSRAAVATERAGYGVIDAAGGVQIVTQVPA